MPGGDPRRLDLQLAFGNLPPNVHPPATRALPNSTLVWRRWSNTRFGEIGRGYPVGSMLPRVSASPARLNAKSAGYPIGVAAGLRQSAGLNNPQR